MLERLEPDLNVAVLEAAAAFFTFLIAAPVAAPVADAAAQLLREKNKKRKNEQENMILKEQLYLCFGPNNFFQNIPALLDEAAVIDIIFIIGGIADADDAVRTC